MQCPKLIVKNGKICINELKKSLVGLAPSVSGI